MLRFEVSRSGLTVQSEFRARFKKDAPHKNNITKWYRQFVETGCLCQSKSPRRPRASDGNIERVREAFQRLYENAAVLLTLDTAGLISHNSHWAL
jgi:transposase